MKWIALFCIFLIQSVFADVIVDPQTDPLARQQLESLVWVQDHIAQAQSKKFEKSHFIEATPYIVSRPIPLPNEVDAAEFVFQEQIFMFMSQDYLWFCQFALNALWKVTDSVELNAWGVDGDGEVWCYPRI